MRELRKLSCGIADYSETDVVEKFDELLHNTFILKKSYSSNKYVHYFEWGSKSMHFFDVNKMTSHKVALTNTFNIPKFCRTVVTDEGRIFCIGGRHQDNMCCDSLKSSNINVCEVPQTRFVFAVIRNDCCLSAPK